MATSDQIVPHVSNVADRVGFYVIKASIAIMNEVNTTPNHTERVAFANKVFISDYDLMNYTNAVLSNPTNMTNFDATESDYGISDPDMEFTVNAAYNAFAGVAT
ncbi:MAG: hypothetical protein EP297_00135 [Gammaproteobacteria bacterium]|nr:MAG: hypothetical protein EP297_00135 [Gammaproteobacteria bacterium]